MVLVIFLMYMRVLNQYKYNQSKFYPGMILSNEPGYYKKGKFELE